MYHYAISTDLTITVEPEWREAVRKAKIKRIELELLSNEEGYEAGESEAVRALGEMQSAGIIEISSVHMPWGRPYWSLNEEERKEGSDNLLRYMKFISPLKSKNYTLHASIEPVADGERGAVIAAMRRTIAELLPFLQEQGASANVEILPRSCVGRRPGELMEITEGFPKENVGICFDVNHLCGCPEMLPEYIDMCGDRIKTFHISDYDGIDECHWYPGIGIIDWGTVMDSIRKIKQDLLLIFEVSGFVHVPAWQESYHKLPWEIPLRNAEDCAFFMENASELRRRQAEFIVP